MKNIPPSDTPKSPLAFEEAKSRFIEAWGALGTTWGISRSMAQVHALLLLAQEPLSAQAVMDALNISQGNANMNLRALMDWGLVEKITKLGERKEFFVAEKDMWEVTRRIVRERRKRELEPIFKVLEELKQVEAQSEEEAQKAAHFIKITEEISTFAARAEQAIDMMLKLSENKLVEKILKP
ncbi:GbsR/MarR family transcriptional regulator [Hugenholtzia roseola]|uniref:GbsR/MarR family transcriptional regulator n=1 Tax=Hugenholtzia roseola TaxID=1002 RepID=UPI0006855C61|nr:MarR family transcriptional regulator [Hugenholtzia roseola]